MLKSYNELLGLNIFMLGVVVLFICLIFLVLASHTRKFLDPPKFDTFYSKGALAQDNINLKNQVIADMQASYKKNQKNQVWKSRFYNIALYCFIISILLLFLGIMEI